MATLGHRASTSHPKPFGTQRGSSIWSHLMWTLTLPSDWQAITQGQETNQAVTEKQRTSQWSIHAPTEALTLAANHFVVQKKSWRDIQLATYLFA